LVSHYKCYLYLMSDDFILSVVVVTIQGQTVLLSITLLFE
jgi:hypothetical protein